MDSIQVSIATTSEAIDAVCAALQTIDCMHVEIVDDLPTMQAHLAEQAQYWDYIDEKELTKNGAQPCVRLYLNDDDSAEERVQLIQEQMQNLLQMDVGLDFGSLQIETQHLKEEDWANNWREFYKPIEIGERLIVVPAWESVPDTNRVKLILEPGLVFGTGEHQTTQLCLAALEKAVKGGDDVLDLGSGSGILSIAALLLGAKKAVAIDVDPNAQQIAYANACQNQIDLDRYEVLSGNVLIEEQAQETISVRKYDVVVANIVADVILAIKPFIPKWLKNEGLLIVSGIIDDRAEEVISAYQKAGFMLQEAKENGGWYALCFFHPHSKRNNIK